MNIIALPFLHLSSFCPFLSSADHIFTFLLPKLIIFPSFLSLLVFSISTFRLILKVNANKEHVLYCDSNSFHYRARKWAFYLSSHYPCPFHKGKFLASWSSEFLLYTTSSTFCHLLLGAIIGSWLSFTVIYFSLDFSGLLVCFVLLLWSEMSAIFISLMSYKFMFILLNMWNLFHFSLWKDYFWYPLSFSSYCIDCFLHCYPYVTLEFLCIGFLM